MNTVLSILSVSLLAASPLAAQAPEQPAEVKAEEIMTVTIIMRHVGSNIPDKFTSYLSVSRGFLTMPLHDPGARGWIATVTLDRTENKPSSHFEFQVSDASLLETRSSELTPFYQRPLEVIAVELPLQVGAEIPVYKAPNLSVSILFE